MLVDDAARRGFEGRGQRRRRFGDVVVDERLQLRRLVALTRNVADQKEQLRLPLAEVAHELDAAAPTSRCCCRTATAGGCSRAVAR